MKRTFKNPAVTLLGAAVGAGLVLILSGGLGGGSSVAAPSGVIPGVPQFTPGTELPLSRALEAGEEDHLVSEPDHFLGRVATPFDGDERFLLPHAPSVSAQAPPQELFEEYDEEALIEEEEEEFVEVLEGSETSSRSLSDGRYLFRGEQVQNEDGEWVRHGRWQAWHRNGVRDEEGAYRGGNEDGPWEWWYDNGQQMARGSFINGRRVGPWIFWYEEGELMMTGSYDDEGAANSTWVYYHSNGRKASEGEMVNDHPEGRWTAWDEWGSVNLERSGVYKRGERISP